MNSKTILITLNENDLESIVFDCIDRALKLNTPDSDTSTHLNEIGPIALAMEITGLAKQTIYGLVSEQKIPHMKRGNRLYFSREELTNWIKEGKQQTIEDIEEEANKFLSSRNRMNNK